MKFESKEEKQRFLKALLNKGFEAAKAETLNGKVIPVLKGTKIELLGELLTSDEIKEKYPGTLVVECNDQETINLIKEL